MQAAFAIQKATADDEGRMEALFKRFEPEIRRAFLISVLNMRNSFTEAELTARLNAGQIDLTINEMMAEFDRVVNTVTGAYITSGESAAAFITLATNNFIGFNVVNQGAINEMTTESLRLITEFTSGQVQATREALLEGIEAGLNPRAQARVIRQSIGLTSGQVGWVANYRRLLEEGSSEALNRKLRDRRFDSTVERSIANDEPLTQAQINRMVDRYQERALRYRSEVIGRTEALRATNLGSQQMWTQAIESGRFTADQITQKWITAEDERVRSTHITMQGQVRPVGEPFVTGGGVLLKQPGDINGPAEETIQCRCVLATRLRF